MSYVLSSRIGKCFIGNRTAKDILRCLADYADDSGKNCFPSRETVVHETEINPKSFAAAIQFLENNGWIKVNRHQKNNSNSYELNIEKLLIESQKEFERVDPKTGRPKNGSTQKRINSRSENGSTVDPKTDQDPINTLSTTQSDTYMSVEQNSTNSPATETEKFELTSETQPEEEVRAESPGKRIQTVASHCPQMKLIDLYHECLPCLPMVRSWNTASRRQNMAARWREIVISRGYQTEEEALIFFRQFFNFVGRSPFLCGQNKNNDGRSWRADLPWLMKAENFAKTCDRRYHDGH